MAQTTEERIGEIEKQVLVMKTYAKVATAVAAIFGLTGAWGISVLSKARTEILEAQDSTTKLTGAVAIQRSRIDELSKLVNPEEVNARVGRTIAMLAPNLVGGLIRDEAGRIVSTAMAREGAGCALLDRGRLQICWGSQELREPNTNPHTRQFSINFPRPFLGQPVVIPGISTNSSGAAPAIYQFAISESGYTGSVNNMLVSQSKQDGQVVINYVAFGIPKPQ